MKSLQHIILGCIVLVASTAHAQWIQTNGPSGGAGQNAFATMGSVLFAGTASFGVYRSTDDGASWTAANDGLTGIADGVVAFCIEGTHLYASVLNTGVFLSIDSGAHWTNVTNNLPTGYVWALAAIETTIYAGCASSGVWRSTDYGGHWVGYGSGMTYPYINALCVLGTTLFAGYAESSSPPNDAQGGVYRSTDGGVTWTTVFQNGPKDNCRALTTIGARIFAAVGLGETYVSSDTGRTWATTLAHGSDRLTTYDGAVYAGTGVNGVWRTIDTGATWKQLGSQFNNTTIWALGASRTRVFVGLDNGLFASRDSGATWEERDFKLTYRPLNSLASLGAHLFVGTNNGVYMTDDSGSSWNAASKGLPSASIGTLYVNATTIYTSAGTYGIYLSSDSGASWRRMIAQPSSLDEYTVLAFRDSAIFAATSSHGVFSSSNGGATWTPIGLAGVRFVQSIAVMGNDIYAAVSPGNSVGGVYHAMIGDTSWALISDPFPATPVDMVFANHGALYALTDMRGVFRTMNAGVDWDSLVTGLVPVSGRYYVHAMCGYDSLVFVSDLRDVYAMRDGSLRWTNINENLPPIPDAYNGVNPIAICGSDLYLVSGAGMFRRPVGDIRVDVREIAGTAPEGFRLDQNYPNPFRGTTHITFSVSHSGTIDLGVYDLFGRKVSTVAHGRLNAGVFSARFDGTQLPKGTYAYLLRFDDRVQSRVFVLD